MAAVSALGCSVADRGASDVEGSEDAVVVDNRTPEARAQYLANIAFAKRYQPKCPPRQDSLQSRKKRVLVTGFGRFMHIQDNATGRIVSRIAGIDYPLTSAPAPGVVDEPEPQTSVGTKTHTLPKSGEVEFCGMVLPVFWDLASILIAKEIEEFEPDLVIMNGVAGSRQPLYIELGSVNRAMRSADGSDVLVPYAPEGREPVLVQGAAVLRGLRMSWETALKAADRSIERRANESDGETKLADILTGAKLAGFPRGGNTYLCNNVTYVTNYLMDRPGRPITLLKALDRRGPEDDYVKVEINRDMRRTPRVFMHWPSDLVGRDPLLDEAAGVLTDVADAQLEVLASGQEPATVGDNEKADPSLRGGDFF